MKCPKCTNAMETVAVEGVEVDRCTACGGLWFDLVEQEILKKVAGSEKIDTGDPKTGKLLNSVRRADCPVCHTRMVKMVDLKQPHIWYESCNVCGGVFFDAGEFTDFKKATIGDFFKGLFAKERR